MLSRILVFTCAFAAANAASADLILGAQIGRQSLDIRVTDSFGNVEEDTSESDTSLGLIVGVGEPGGGSRIVAEWHAFSIGDEVDLDLLDVSYSYFFPSLTKSSDSQLRPFIGGDLGYGWLDVSAIPGYNSGDDSNILYGVRAGLNLALGNRVEFEVGARYTVVDLDAELDSRFPFLDPAHYEVENNKGWWVGFNFGF
ncbi:MAG: hypothetical protein HPY82_25940 [Gammaproteobacteria bacterium]|nr:hypothetical protein [Gammaproteobacteria bacterium]